MRKLLLLAVAVVAAACNSSGTGVFADLRGPQAIVAFRGMNLFVPGTVVPLLAIAASRGNELRFVDPQADAPLRAPGLYAVLAVPTLARPTVLASASMGMGQDQSGNPVSVPDVLVVSSGGTEIQLVATWLDGAPPSGYGVITTWDLASLPGMTGSQVLSMVGTAAAGGQAVPHQARVVVGLSGGVDGLGGKLAVLDFQQAADGSIALVDTPTVKVVGFDPVSLAASPDSAHVYAATPDTITDSTGLSVQGVAEIDVTAADAASWTVRGFDGRAPTFAVAATQVGERLAVSTQDFGRPAYRVYALIDPTACGLGVPTSRISCGAATFDPATGTLAPDPSPGPSPIGAQIPVQPFRTPLYLPVKSLALSVGLPPSTGTLQCGPGSPQPPLACPAGVNGIGWPQQLMEIQSEIGFQWTTGVASIAGSDGYVYVEDLGHMCPPDDTFLLDSLGTRTQVSLASSAPPATTPNGNYIGLYNDYPAAGTPGFVYLAGDLPAAFIVWPGYTPNDTWSLTWQGVLPGLSQVRAVLARNPAGQLYLAVQQPVNPALPPPTGPDSWVVGAYLALVDGSPNPELAVHASDQWPAGDTALFFPDVDDSGCQGPPQAGAPLPPYETTITSTLARDQVLYPGGALALSVPAPAAGATQPTPTQCLIDYYDKNPSLLPTMVTTSVRASGLVLVSATLGYAGRPELGTRYNLAWQVEDGLSGEPLVLARKARRQFYPGGPYGAPYYGNPCPPGTGACYAGFPEMTDPMQTGPVIGFRAGVVCTTGCQGGDIYPVRDAKLSFNTLSGMAPMSRRPSDVATATASVSFDKTVFTDTTSQGTGEAFYVTFTGDVLFVLPPALGLTSTKTIR